jgi:fatty-acyl-CoA synthase
MHSNYIKSGTTGLPKGALISYHSFLNAMRFEYLVPGCRESNRVSCIPIPVFHIFGLACGTISPLINSTKTIFPHMLPDTISTMKAIQDEKCTALKGSPTIFFNLLESPERKNYDLSSLELFGASVVPRDLLMKIKSELKLKHVLIM